MKIRQATIDRKYINCFFSWFVRHINRNKDKTGPDIKTLKFYQTREQFPHLYQEIEDYSFQEFLAPCISKIMCYKLFLYIILIYNSYSGFSHLLLHKKRNIYGYELNFKLNWNNKSLYFILFYFIILLLLLLLLLSFILYY